MIDTFLLFPSLEAIPEMFRNRAKVRPDKTYVIDPRDLDKTDLAMLLHAADPAREVHKSPHSKDAFTISRADAQDHEKYRRVKAAAEAAGTTVTIGDSKDTTPTPVFKITREQCQDFSFYLEMKKKAEEAGGVLEFVR